MNEEAMEKRILGYDLAKGIAMFLVILLHFSFYTRYYAGDVAGNIATSLCVICVPLFFAVNGALLLPRPLDCHKHYRKVLLIVGIVAIWKTIAAIFFILFDKSYTVNIKEFLKFQFGGNFGEYPTGYFWFMNALIAIYLIYPLIKLIVDKRGAALWSCLAVLFAFTVCKDTITVILNMVGFATHHELASLLESLNEYNLFGNYGYVMLYFIVGGLLGEHVAEILSKKDNQCFTLVKCWLYAIICFAFIFGIQRFQHATTGLNLTVDYGYWLLPTFIATFSVLLICIRATSDNAIVHRIITEIGKNTFGIYMLHMFALVIFSHLEMLPFLAWIGQLQSGINTIVNIFFAAVLFICCAVLSVGLRKIPGIRVLLSL